MATYYVSQQVGSDSNAGTGPGVGQAWATVGKAFTSGQAAGNTIYIGPGTYRESTLTTSVAGGSGTHIQWIGDPTGRYLTSDTPGRVRITRSDVNDTPQTGAVLDAGTYAYHDFYNLYIDGSTAAYTILMGANVTLNNCTVHGAYQYAIQASAGTCNDCYVIGADRAFYITGTDFVANRCVLFAVYYGAYGTSAGYGTFNNCLCIGAAQSAAFRNVNCNNTTVFGCSIGFRDGIFRNCMAVGSSNGGFYGSDATMTLTNCSAYYCRYGFYGSATLTLAADSYYGGCNAASSGTIAGAGTAKAPPLFDFYEQARIYEPFLLPDRNSGNNTYLPSGTDILGRVRPSGNGTCERGCYEVVNDANNWTVYQTTAPSVQLNRGGQSVLYLPVKEGQDLTVTVQSKWLNTNVALKPQLLLRGTGITTQTATSTADSDTWQELSVNATAAEDAVLEIVFYARDTGTSNAVAYFSDIAITVA